jgi:hypothetical protein
MERSGAGAATGAATGAAIGDAWGAEETGGMSLSLSTARGWAGSQPAMAAVPAMHSAMTEIAAPALNAEKRLLTVGIFLMIAMMISFVFFAETQD